jgi:hypothetical protein
MQIHLAPLIGFSLIEIPVSYSSEVLAWPSMNPSSRLRDTLNLWMAANEEKTAGKIRHPFQSTNRN